MAQPLKKNLLVATHWLTVLLLLATLPRATAQSPRLANYVINVTLDAQRQLLDGSEQLTWTNPSSDTIRTLQFHLYLNAFRNTRSTFMRESGGQLRGVALDRNKADGWGWTDVTSLRVTGPAAPGPELVSRLRFVQPDDQNADDRTVVELPLDQPVLPRQSIKLAIGFRAKLPRIFARTGFSGYSDKFRYFLVGQWFPKIGVYEAAGQRYATRGGWNCHQFHANSEFYADFGTYDVALTVPNNYTVGATGALRREQANANGTKTLRFGAADVVDFAWTASPRFQVATDHWQHVAIRLLVQPEHADQADRYLSSVKIALAYFDRHVGRYPYANLTIVDPPLSGQGSAGMEYPTFITGGTVWNLPSGIRAAQAVTVHEFGHQYFMGLLASNEFEEAWLDEGFTQYMETRIMDETYGAHKAVINFWDYHLGDLAETREGYVNMRNPRVAESYRYAWQFPTQDAYAALTYSKTATWLTTLDRTLGRATMDDILRTYFDRWKFRHPCAKDFIAVANEVTRRHHGTRFGPDLNWFFDQVLYGTQLCNYQLAAVDNAPVEAAAGVGNNHTLLKGNPPSEIQHYRATVRVERIGEMTMPTDVLVHFADGREVTERWDGLARSRTFTYEGPARVEWAKIDPQQQNLMDVNLANNSFTVKPSAAPAWKYTIKFLFWTQNLMQWLSMLA